MMYLGSCVAVTPYAAELGWCPVSIGPFFAHLVAEDPLQYGRTTLQKTHFPQYTPEAGVALAIEPLGFTKSSAGNCVATPRLVVPMARNC